jgi:hypothetical protein
MASAKDKLAAVTSVPEPPDCDFSGTSLQLWTYSFQGKSIYTWGFESQLADLRVLLNITQASTVQIDLEDSDFEILNDPLFAHWAWDIEDVSLSSQKKFKPTRLSNSTNNAYLGDSANLEWVLGKKPIDFQLGPDSSPVAFRLCGIQTQRTALTLTLEDRAASWLRDQKGHKSWDRSQHTRAQFVAQLCREAGVDYFIPELNVNEPVATDTSKTASILANIKNPNGKGLSKTGHLTVLGKPMSDTQKQIANILLGECHRLSAPLVCWQAILYAGVGETGLGTNATTYTNNGAGAIGVLQGTNSYWDSHPRDVAGQADCFLQGGKGFNSAISMAKSGITDMAEIAVKSEVPSIWPVNAYEKEWGPTLDAGLRGEIDQIIAAYGGPALTTAGTATTSGSYAFTRGANETSFDAIQRLASEVAWYAFVRQNRLWFVSGNYLFSQDPQLTVERGVNGVDYIDIDMDMGERDQIAQCMVYCRSGLWTALPGMVVEVIKRGPASGKWIVAAVENHPRDETQECIVTLQKPIPKRAEPTAGSSATPNKPKNAPNVNGLSNPAPGASAGRLDMGIDGNYSKDGARAPYDGTVYTTPARSGWPGQGSYFWIKNADQSGADYTRAMYFAEGATPVVADGTKVKSGQLIGSPVASGGNGTPGNFEIGPANTTNGEPLAKSYGLGTSGATKMVEAFSTWLQGAGMFAPSSINNAGRA